MASEITHDNKIVIYRVKPELLNSARFAVIDHLVDNVIQLM